MTEKPNVNGDFNRYAASEREDAASVRHFVQQHDGLDQDARLFLAGDFGRKLLVKFGTDTALTIRSVMADLQLPLPADGDSFLDATKGVMLFLNRYGIVLRMETMDVDPPTRINDSAWVLRPFATLDVGNALIEICPGCKTTTDPKLKDVLYKKLYQERILLWDVQQDNVGYLPLKTASFPAGVPVVIDRPAVRRLSAGTAQALSALHIEATDNLLRAEADYYRPFTESFRAAWPLNQLKPVPGAIAGFWAFCEKQAKKGQLIAGWKDTAVHADSSKGRSIAGIGQHYNMLLSTKPL